MPQKIDPESPTNQTGNEELPDEAESVYWAGDGGFNLNNPEDYDESIFPDDLDLSEVPARTRGSTSPTIRYQRGEELPIPIANDIWHSFNDRMVVLNGNGDRIHDPTGDDIRLKK